MLHERLGMKGTRIHVFDSHVDAANRWMKQLMESLALGDDEQQRALHALRAGLHAIRDRLPAHEVLDLSAQLPVVIRGIFFEGWTLSNDPTRIRDRGAMIARVAAELAPDSRLVAVDVLAAVIHLLVEHVSHGEIEHLLATLPKPIATLWHDLSGPALKPRAEVHRTGYSR
jgi:uncharacterized protein (DUF2267 family)